MAMPLETRISVREGSWQQYDWVREGEVMVPMRDGVRLATDIYRPALDGQALSGPFPVLMERTPYGKVRDDLTAMAKYFARRGYVVAVQDVRGRYDSEGEWYAFAKEGPDGKDALDWLAAQSYCDGQVGTIGLSYSGSDQTALASMAPEGLAAMFVSEGMANYHTSAMRQNGALEQRFLIYVFYMAISSKEAIADRRLRLLLQRERAHLGDWLRRLPLRAGQTPLRHLPTYEQWVIDIATHGDYDGYWKQLGYSAEEYYDQHKDVPVTLLTGWYDSYTRSTTDMYVALSKMKRGPVRLIVGPWVHGVGTMQQSWNGDVDFGQDGAMDSYNDLRLRWFDHHLKGLATGVDAEPPVRLFVMGGGGGYTTPEGRLFHGGAWRSEREWPLARTAWTPYYLHGDGTLAPEPPAAAASRSSYTFDPRDPVPTIGGNISVGFEILPNGGYDQRGDPRFFGCTDRLPLSARADVLVFQTPPLDRDIEVTGPLVVRLWASSSAIDTDFTAKLLDVYPPSPDSADGFALNLSDSIIRARYRKDRTRAEFLTPDQVEEFEIVLYPTSNRFATGHRIRLDISSSNFPRFDVNPNTGEPLGRHRRFELAHQTICHDTAHPSHIILPVIPAE
jgi:uncharacterized protein